MCEKWEEKNGLDCNVLKDALALHQAPGSWSDARSSERTGGIRQLSEASSHPKARRPEGHVERRQIGR